MLPETGASCIILRLDWVEERTEPEYSMIHDEKEDLVNLSRRGTIFARSSDSSSDTVMVIQQYKGTRIGGSNRKIQQQG